jgi:hypothetical protein
MPAPLPGKTKHTIAQATPRAREQPKRQHGIVPAAIEFPQTMTPFSKRAISPISPDRYTSSPPPSPPVRPACSYYETQPTMTASKALKQPCTCSVVRSCDVLKRYGRACGTFSDACVYPATRAWHTTFSRPRYSLNCERPCTVKGDAITRPKHLPCCSLR